MNRDPVELGPKDVVDANIAFHNALADTYDEEQPHFRPENKALVLERLKYFAKSVGNKVLLDLGCGTGFIIHLALPLYESIYGIDVTAAMLSKVDTSSGKVRLFETNTETIPLDSGVVDVVTANSFLHHLYDIRPTVSEAFRVLRKGGVFYSEEDPNFHFWQALKDLPTSGSSILQREIESVQKTDEIVEGTKGVDVETVRVAEYQKMVLGGIQPEKLRDLLQEIGFSSINIQHYWFLGEGVVLHGKSALAVQVIGDYLRNVLPLSSHLFKYLRVEAYK